MPLEKCIQQQKNLLGSQITLTIICKNDQQKKAEEQIQKAFLEMKRIEKTFSRFRKGNELWNLNQNKNIWQEISEEMYLLLEFCLEIKKLTGGIFDPTIKSILEGWGYDEEYSLKESFEGNTGNIEIRNKHYKIQNNQKTDRLIASDKNTYQAKITAEVDFGAIGKGYALDRILPFFEEFENICLDAGGDLYLRGKNEKEKAWKILFEHPQDDAYAIGELEYQEKGIFLAASSPIKRKWKQYHHLVDAKAKIPAKKTASVYLQTHSGILADALSTSFFVMSSEKVAEILAHVPAQTMMISPDGKIMKTENFLGKLYE